MTAQRETTIWGPVVAAYPLWKATFATAYSGPGARAVVQKTHALRTLVQDAQPSPIKVGGADFPFHRPRLLQAEIEPRDGGWNQLVLGAGTINADTIFLEDISDKSKDFANVLVAPREPDGSWTGGKTTMETPEFGLVAGRLRVWIPLVARQSGDPVEKEPWLGYAPIGAEHRLFTGVTGSGGAIDGVRVLAGMIDKKVYLPAELTSEGIAFFAQVPDPLTAFGGGTGKVWARVRLFERPDSVKGDRRYGLAFEGACKDPEPPSTWSFPSPDPDTGHADTLESGFASVFSGARELGVRIDFDRRPAVPPFFWELGIRAGGSRPTFPRTASGWTCVFDEALFRINVLSKVDGLPATATVRCDSARLVIDKSSARIEFASRAGPSGKRKLPLARNHTAPHWHVGAVQAKTFAAARLPLVEVEKRLRRLYADARVIDPALDKTVPAFVPIEHGWLQVPLVSTTVTPTSHIVQSVVDGTAAFALDADGERALEVSAASASDLVVVIEKGARPGCQALSFAFDDSAGRMRGLVHVADCSPAGGEILPRLRPGATREWPVVFGQGEVGNAISVLAPDPVLGSFALDVPAGDEAAPETLLLSWQRDGAWITTRNLAQTRGSGRPVAARSLVPRRVKRGCRLTRSAGSVVPALHDDDLGAVWDAFAAPEEGRAEYQTSQIQPALPGIERHGIDANYTYSLRHDLPPLDDLFAAMQIEDTPLLRLGQKDAPGAGKMTSLATAAAPGRLRDAWRALCDNDRLTRTRYRFAFERGDIKVDVANLALPFVQKDAAFAFEIDNGAKLPLGRYLLDGKAYAGAEALAGRKDSLRIVKSGESIRVTLQGNAAKRWSPLASRMLYDLAGTGMHRDAVLDRPVEILSAPDTGERIELTTLAAPLALEADLQFWFRDIPFKNGEFDGSSGVDGFLGDIDARAPGAFARGLYEWRIWSSEKKRASDIPLSQGFLARPLRLHWIAGSSAALTRLELVAALIAPEALDASRESEAGETGPARNLVLITYVAAVGGGFERSVKRVKIEAGAIQPFTKKDITDGLDRASFELHPQVALTQYGTDSVPRHGSLRCSIAADGSIAEADLTLKLFGQTVTFVKESGWDDLRGNAGIDFKPPTSAAGTIELRSPRLVWDTGWDPAESASFEARPRLNLPFAGNDGAVLHLAIDLAQSRIRWLGAEIPMTAKIDHDSAVIAITGSGLSGAPVIGLSFNGGSATALFAVLDQLMVSGFAQVAAEHAEEGKPHTVRLAHAFRFTKSGWTDDLAVDFTAGGSSTVEWPMKVVAARGDRPEDELAKVSTVSIEGGDALRHHVRCAVRGATMPTTSLEASGRLAAPWHLSMRAEHELTSPAGQVLRWTSLDEVMIGDLERLSAQADENTSAAQSAYGFGARYAGTYRGRTSNTLPDMLRPGLFARSLVAAGFPDALVEEALAGAQTKGLVLFGAAVSLFVLDGGSSVPLALPWLLGTEGAVLGPLAALRQAPVAGQKTWNAAWFDLRAERMLPSAPGSPLALGDPSAARIASQIERAGESPAARPFLSSVEQPFFEDPAGQIDIAQAPLFLRSLVTLAGAWNALVALDDLQSRVVQPLVRSDGSCALFSTSLGSPMTLPRDTLRLVCIDRDAVAFREPRADLELGSVGSATEAVLRTLRGAMTRPPLLFAMVSFSAFEEETAQLALWRNVELSGRSVLAPSDWVEPVDPPLRDPSDRLFISPSLGWPEPPAPSLLPEALVMGENRPFQNEQTAIAGRSASFASNAGGGPSAHPWIALRLQPVFDAMALPGVMAAAPRQLDVVPRRPRLPAEKRQPNIVPSRFATISVGYRPGAAHLTTTALKSLGSEIVDGDQRVIAHRAGYHPVLAGQDRMPRASILPADIDNLDWRRETFVVPGGRKCRIERAPAIAFRTYARSSDPASDIPPPVALVVLKAFGALVDFTQSPKLTLAIDGPAFPDWHPYSWREFRLRIGERSWIFAAEDRDGAITLTLGTAAAAEAAVYALSVTGDTVIACELTLATGAPSSDPKAPLAAPNLTLQLPLTIARATEPVLAVPGATLIFGDPAYDRMLSSMTASDTKRIDDKLAILAADRQTYDLVSPVLISLGLKGADGAISRPATYRLTIKRFREGEAVQTECVFEIGANMAVASLSIDRMIAAGLKSVLPGDRLTLTADFEFAGKPYALSLQLSITREPSVPPAPAVYHLLTLHGDPAAFDAATALSASGPTPEIVEYPALENDLMKGYVRRRGLFAWHFAPEVGAYFERFGYLIKIDQSGAGQLPSVVDDFEPAAAEPPSQPPVIRVPASKRKTAKAAA